ncbi:MAG: Trm112 family protein [Pseudomonadota bacterium]
MTSPKHLQLYICPVSKGSLHYRPEHAELWCRLSRLAYPVRGGMPVLRQDQARRLTDAETASLPT